MRLLSAFLLILAALPAVAQEVRYFNGQDFKGGFYLVPETLPPEGEKMWVMVDVHGAGGLRGESGGRWMFEVAAPEPVIVIVPSFPNGYQGGDGQNAAQLIANLEAVAAQYDVYDKMFVHGFSGGGQFAHRFTMNEPGHVLACSAHGSGSWACDGGYGSISAAAAKVPFFISCGEKDTAYSVQGYPHTRIEWYRLFAAKLEQRDFPFFGTTWPNSGHSLPRESRETVGALFRLAALSQLPEAEGWSGDLDAVVDRAYEISGRPVPLTLDQMSQVVITANDAIVAGRVPDTAATLRFLSEHPASRWASVTELAPLRDHCRKVAKTYLTERDASGSPLEGAALDRFRRATEGLDWEP